jgi:NAD-dependent dihydropyrimidine dehydrogenase PreA subunit/flavodoxin
LKAEKAENRKQASVRYGDIMKSKNVDIYYFSGTGNTFLAAKKMKEIFEKNGRVCNLTKLETAGPQKINKDNAIGIAFPVACFSTYPFVWDFIKKLPETSGTEIFMLATMGGSAGAAKGPIRAAVVKKGYSPIGAEEIVMPSNIFYIESEEACKAIVSKGLLSVERFAEDLLRGDTMWKPGGLRSGIMYALFGLLAVSWNFKMGQKWFMMRLDRTKCTKCGICARLCPVKNIKMNEYPEYGLDCQYCLRCCSLCPEKALRVVFNKGGKTYSAVKAEDFMDSQLIK